MVQPLGKPTSKTEEGKGVFRKTPQQVTEQSRGSTHNLRGRRPHLLLFFLKRFFIDLEKEEVTERETLTSEQNINQLPAAHPLMGMEVPTQACALTMN